MGFNRYGGDRDRRSGGGGGGFRRRFDGPRQMHKIICSDCGQEAEVPFKPREGTPVYCRDCFTKRKESGTSAGPVREVEKKKPVKKDEEVEDKEVEETEETDEEIEDEESEDESTESEDE